MTSALAGVVMAATAALASNDPLFSQQWGLSGATASINAPQAWCASTGSGILVADVDTGVEFSHPDLAGRLVPGARFTGGSGTEDPDHSAANLGDGVGHGTGTTGLMVANKDDRTGIAGVAPNARVMVVKVFDDSGSGYTNDAAAGIRWAADHGAQVINISLGGDPTGATGVHTSLVPDANIVNAIKYAAGKHVAVAASAGNNETQLPVSQYDQIAQVALVVGAVGPGGEAAWYTSSGNIYAPGGDDPNGTGSSAINVVTPYKGHAWVSWQGTSFAAPHVAGTLALLMSRGLSAEAARSQIINTSVNRQGLPELDAAGALGTSGGCGTAPPTKNDAGGTAAHGGGNGTTRAPVTARGPASARQPASAAPTSPSSVPTSIPSPTPSASPSPSGPVAETFPSPRVLAHDPPASQSGEQVPGALIAAGLVGGISVGYGALRLFQALR